MFAALLGALLAAPSVSEAQPCITCRTEKCPTKKGMTDWCGSGADPQAPAPSTSPSSANPAPPIKHSLLKLRIESEPPGALLQIDGRAALLRAPATAALSKGSHIVIATLPSHEARTLTVELSKSGQVARLSLQPIVAPPPPEIVKAPPPPEVKKAPPPVEDLEPAPPPLIVEIEKPAPPPPVSVSVSPPTTTTIVPPQSVAAHSGLDRSTRALLIAGGTFAGVGLVGVIIGAGLFGAAQADHSRFMMTTDEFVKVDILNRFAMFDRASIASYTLGGALLTGGAVLLSIGIYKHSVRRKAGH